MADVYYGIPQAKGNNEEAEKKSSTIMYPQRATQFLKSQLIGRNKAIRYPNSIKPWPQEEMDTTDVMTRTRKLFTKWGVSTQVQHNETAHLLEQGMLGIK